MKHITLKWAEKFRKLYQNDKLSDVDIINNFLNYCTTEENKVSKRWDKKVKEDKKKKLSK